MKSFFFILLFIIAGCVSSIDPDSVSGSDFSLKTSVRPEFVEARMYNESETNVTVYEPLEITVERYGVDGWTRLRVPYCSCGESCPAPPPILILGSLAEYTIQWDRQEVWCEGIPATEIRIPATPGVYRFVFEYQKEGEQRQTQYVEFRL